VGRITGVTGFGGAADQIETTDLDSVEHEFIAGLPNPGALSVPINFDLGVRVHRDLLALYQAGTSVKWVVGLSDGTAPPTSAGGTITYPTTRSYRTFTGYIADFPVDIALNSKLEGTLSVQRSGPLTNNFKAIP
jgi:hypothetical protein